MNAKEILEYFQHRQGRIIDLIREIVDIESPSHNAEQSRKVADWVEEQATQTGVDIAVERVSVEDGDHILIRAFPADGTHTFLLGHTDTVHPIGTNAKNPGLRLTRLLFYPMLFRRNSRESCVYCPVQTNSPPIFLRLRA